MPDLNHIREVVARCGKRTSKIINNRFRCQCPAHDGIGMSVQFKQQPSGKISFDCFSHHCEFEDMLSALDLNLSDFYPESMLKPSQRRYEPAKDDVVLAMANDRRARGERLTDSEKAVELQAWMRRKAYAG